MASVRASLILTHRRAGQVLALPIFVWFVSGIVMAFTGGMPRLTPEDRLRRLAPMDLSAIHVGADAAALVPGAAVNRIVLLMILGRPAYRLPAREPIIRFADTGEPLGHVDRRAAMQIAASFIGADVDAVHYAGELDEPDQWTVGQSIEMPLHKMIAGDGDGTEVYVSESSGEVVMITDRRSRALAWIGAIPHWWYLAALRRHAVVWRRAILITSSCGMLVALIGVALAPLQRRVRYSGVIRWHYRSGVVFGAFAVTWLLSGWLSLQPWNWTPDSAAGAAVERALRGGAIDPRIFPMPTPERARMMARSIHGPIKEIELINRTGTPALIIHGESERAVVSARTLDALPPLRSPDVVAHVRAAASVGIESADELPDYDAYYRDRDRAAPLPVICVKLDDPDSTWIYVDAATGSVAARFTRRQRLERWVYHGLHSLDLPLVYARRPIWAFAITLLCVGGAVLSGLAVLMTARRAAR